MTQPDESHLTGGHAAFIEQLYQRYLENPSNIDPSWVQYFASLADNQTTVKAANQGPSWGSRIPMPEEDEGEVVPSGKGKAVQQDCRYQGELLTKAFREKGHYLARLDPLNREKRCSEEELGLSAEHFGLSASDMKQSIDTKAFMPSSSMSLSELLQKMRTAYSGTVAMEASYLRDDKERQWIFDHFEALSENVITADEQHKILRSVLQVEMFEQFLQAKFPGGKRFSIEGGDHAVTFVETVMDYASSQGVEKIVIGMAHRGRLNMLTKVLGKSYHAMFAEFQGNPAHPELLDIQGDVKYHLGFSSTQTTRSGAQIDMALLPNPSHLETVDPMLSGKVRAEQDARHDKDRSKVLGVTIHGNAAFSGQGVVMETLAMSELEGYHSGGTIRLVINNQVGFTANLQEGHLSRYPTDIAKTINVPILHVNGDDAEGVVKVARLAARYREIFKKDVVINLMCYRLHGHNEQDEPAFTQPNMYQVIKQHPTPATLYADQLKQQGVITEEQVTAWKDDIKAMLEKEFKGSEAFRPKEAEWLKGRWKDLQYVTKEPEQPKTGVSEKNLKILSKALLTPEEGININSKILRQLKAKLEAVDKGEGLDWSMGEALAFGTLLQEDFPVRLSGEDAARGTFSHRHAEWVDQETEKRYCPLRQATGNTHFEVINSCLSEYGVMGFEYGYSITRPNSLVVWEAQFGDFSNGAQIVIDQCIAAGETKWQRMSGLVLLLPHGYEGQGPEHSSARLERYLQLCADSAYNMQVANCTTPASFFHILRRQLHRPFRKPLIIMTPKSLLRHKRAISYLKDMAEGTCFEPVIGEHDKQIKPQQVKRVLLCSGRVYYDLLEYREEQKIKDVAILRLEQIAPFPHMYLQKLLKQYPEAEIVWCQEEPENMGAWFFVAPKLGLTLSSMKHTNPVPRYVGRVESASPTTGYASVHSQEQMDLMKEAFNKKN